MSEIAQLRKIVLAFVDAMPKCTDCGEPAPRVVSHFNGEQTPYCDKHGAKKQRAFETKYIGAPVDEYPHAEALRAALKKRAALKAAERAVEREREKGAVTG